MTLKRLQIELAEAGEVHAFLHSVANDELLPDFEDVEEAASATLDGCEVHAARKTIMSDMPHSPPRDDIFAIAIRCQDPQQPAGIRESARRVLRWLDDEDPYEVEDEDSESEAESECARDANDDEDEE